MDGGLDTLVAVKLQRFFFCKHPSERKCVSQWIISGKGLLYSIHNVKYWNNWINNPDWCFLAWFFSFSFKCLAKYWLFSVCVYSTVFLFFYTLRFVCKEFRFFFTWEFVFGFILFPNFNSRGGTVLIKRSPWVFLANCFPFIFMSNYFYARYKAQNLQ